MIFTRITGNDLWIRKATFACCILRGVHEYKCALGVSRVQIDTSLDEYVRSNSTDLHSEESLFRTIIPEKHPDSVINDDAHMGLIILSLRAGHEEPSPLEMRYWLLTRDDLLLKYDRLVRPRMNLKVPYCVLSSHWLQLLWPYSAAVEGYEVTLAENLTSPLLRMFKLPQTQMIEDIISRMIQSMRYQRI